MPLVPRGHAAACSRTVGTTRGGRVRCVCLSGFCVWRGVEGGGGARGRVSDEWIEGGGIYLVGWIQVAGSVVVRGESSGVCGTLGVRLIQPQTPSSAKARGSFRFQRKRH